jgi:hypothetical protein
LTFVTGDLSLNLADYHVLVEVNADGSLGAARLSPLSVGTVAASR